MATNTANKLSMSQQQMLESVQNLQNSQKDLMNKYASASTQADRMKISNEMDKNEAIRTSLLLSIGSASVVSNQEIVNKKDELSTKKLLLQLANDEVNEARRAIEEMQQSRAEKERMIKINTYYGKRFMAQAGVMKIFIYMCIPVLFLGILANMGFLPNYIAGLLIVASLVVGIVYIYGAVSDISRRDEMNFDEYKWDFDPSRVGPITNKNEYDKKGAAGVVGCKNEECCSSTTQWNASTNMCDDAQGESSSIKGSSLYNTGKSGVKSVANTASSLLGDLSSNLPKV
jgi:hypothetical protein